MASNLRINLRLIMSCEYPKSPRRLLFSLPMPKLTMCSRVLFITTVLAAVWAIATLFRRKSTRRSAMFVAFIDLCFVGAFIAGVYELRDIAQASCSNFSSSGDFYVSLGPSGFSGNSPFSLNINKTCAMLKASFAFGIMNTIFFFFTSFLLLFMRDREEKEVVTKETYRRRSHDSRYCLHLMLRCNFCHTLIYDIDEVIRVMVVGTAEVRGTADSSTTSECTKGVAKGVNRPAEVALYLFPSYGRSR